MTFSKDHPQKTHQSSEQTVSLDDLLNASPGLSEALEEPQRSSSSSSSSSSMSAEELERLRRSVPLFIDAKGRWWHEGSPFEHERLIAYFNRNLGWRAGEATLHVGMRWCYVRCDVTPFLALKLEAQPDQQELWAHLNTGERLPLRGLELRGEVMFAQLTPERLTRLSAHAQGQCAVWLEESKAPSGFSLRLGERIWPIS
jgi:hypothetical protein